jgi:hypothetical protein
MSEIHFAAWWCFPMFLLLSRLDAQTCLGLSPAKIAGGIAIQDLSLYSSPGESPAAIQWTFQYPTSSIKSLNVEDGPALAQAGKTAICAGDGGSYTCLAVGANDNSISNGVVARVTAVLSPNAASATILIGNPLAVSAAGRPILISSRIPSDGGKRTGSQSISGASFSQDCGPHAPSRRGEGGR